MHEIVIYIKLIGELQENKYVSFVQLIQVIII